MLAAIVSTRALSRRSLFFIPPSIIAWWAIVDVKRSSTIVMGMLGISFLSRLMNGVM